MKLLTYIFILIWTLPSLAQSLTGKINKTTVKVGERFEIKYECNGDGRNFSPPDLSDMQVLSGPNKSSSMTWVNGEFSSSLSYSYILTSSKAGSYTLKPASIQIGKSVVESNPISFEVVNAKNANKQNASSNNQSRNTETNQVDSDANLFMKLYVDKKDAYVGEQIVATYKLYMAAQVVNYAIGRPVFNGFYAQEIEVDPNASMTQEVINGKQYTVATMKRVVLTPQKSGELEIPSMDMEMVVRVQDRPKRQSVFDAFWGAYKNVKVDATSNSELINVSPLPAGQQPKDFTGGVGNFKLSTKTDRSDVNVNEAINLTVSISGSGNIELVSLPEVSFPTDFEVYDPKTRQNISTTGSGSSGSKTYEYVIIPRHAGEFQLKPITFTYFDPSQGKYVQLKSDIPTLKVGRGDGSGTNSETAFIAPRKEDVQILGRDIRFIETDTELIRSESSFYRSTSFYILCLIPFMVMGAAVYVIRLARSQGGNLDRLRSKNAGSIAKSHLKKAKKAMSESDEVFYSEISDALFGYLSDKFVIPLADMSRESIVDGLKSRDVSNALQEDLKKALDECEMVRFAPGVVRGKEEMFAASKRIIEQLENEI